MIYYFFVEGIPRPKGSMRAMAHSRTGKIIMLHDNKGTGPWQAAIECEARKHFNAPLKVPVIVMLSFYMPRPKKAKFLVPAVKPDLDKLVRCALDALSGIAFVDDALVVDLQARKSYRERLGVSIDVKIAP